VEARKDKKMTDWGKATFGSAKDTKKYWANRPASEVMVGVDAYDKSGDSCMADMLEGLGRHPGDEDFKFHQLTRATKNLGAKEPICYQTISFALWLAGHASIAWLSTWSASLNAGNCFKTMGEGAEVADIDQVLQLRGTVISFRAAEVKGPQTVNHWGVIVSDGCAVGSNTDGFDDHGTNGEGYEFEWGQRRFGKFDILKCVEACQNNTKYKDSGGVRVATHRIGDMDLW